MTGFLGYLAELGSWIAALLIGAVPRRYWPRLERSLPLTATAVPAGILTLSVGFAVGVGGFFTYARDLAVSNNAWMMRQFALPSTGHDTAVGLLPYGMSVLTLFIFLFFTPIGLCAVYLVTSGFIRAASAWADDPRGDFILSGMDWAVATLFAKNRRERQRLARERREGPDVPDRLMTGAWAGLPAVDYVILAARRKPEWTAGAIVLTDSDWYRLGVPFNLETPAGLRTAYPLKKLETVEVVRRGIRYELPRLGKPSITQDTRDTRKGSSSI